jgi:TATA-box binding protein (TBP) (component of TFIID and TFIIIB)
MPDFEDGLTACFVGLVQPFKTSVLVFASGKIVITGLKSSEQIEQVIKRIKGLLSFENSLVFGIYTLFYTLFYTFSHA